ncbi:MAG: ATP-binding protein [Pirellulaceae bacterium]
MQILLIESDPFQREEWARRLRSEATNVLSYRGLAEFRAESQQTSFCSFFVGWNINFDEAELAIIQTIRQQTGWIVAITDGSTESSQSAYRAGVNDCIERLATAEMVQSKLEHIAYLAEVDNRLNQSQHLKSIGELAAGIAHEINTPIQYVGDNTRFVQEACHDLTQVLLACQRLLAVADSLDEAGVAMQELKDTVQSAEIQYLIEEIPTAISQTLDGVERVSKIVRAMKEFAHPGSTEMTLIDIDHSISNTIMIARNEWKYVADVETDFDPNLGPIPCLPGEINQVLLNIIVNAAHAISDAIGPSRQSKGTIRISTHFSPPFAVIRISDSGTGIPKSQIGKIFDQFYTTKPIGKGTGQGLAIAHNVIVDKHHGNIEVESVIGEGTTFILKIPLETKTSAPASVALHNTEPAN